MLGTVWESVTAMGGGLGDVLGDLWSWSKARFEEDLDVIVGAIGFLVVIAQIRAQRRNSEREKTIDLFIQCMTDYEELMRERLELSLDPATNEALYPRVKFFYERYWDLQLTEYEFAKHDLIPKSLLTGWLVQLWYSFQDKSAENTLKGVSFEDGWLKIARPNLVKLSPEYCALVDEIIAAPSDDKVRRIVASKVKVRGTADFFSSIK